MLIVVIIVAFEGGASIRPFDASGNGCICVDRLSVPSSTCLCRMGRARILKCSLPFPRGHSNPVFAAERRSPDRLFQLISKFTDAVDLDRIKFERHLILQVFEDSFCIVASGA